MSLKDKINIYKTPNFLQNPCLFCSEQGHLSQDCHSILPTPNKRLVIFSRIFRNSAPQPRKLYYRAIHAKYNSLKNLNSIQEQAWLILEKHHESISMLLDDIYPSSECDNSNERDPVSNSANDTTEQNIPEKTMTESKESKAELLAQNGEKEQGIINPPSIFLQPSLKNKRKSTGSIFEERQKEDSGDIDEESNVDIAEEDIENEVGYVSSKLLQEEEKKKSEKTLNIDENSKQTSSDNNLNSGNGNYNSNNMYLEEKKIIKGVNSSSLPSDKFYSEKDSSINVNSFKNNNSRIKEMQKVSSSDRESKFFTEKDTVHLLQNFDKLEKKAFLDRLNSSSHKTTNTTHISEKRNLASIFSYSKSTSYISSLHKLLRKRNTSINTSQYKATHNKKANYSDYLRYPL